MMYELIISDKAIKQLKKLDKEIQKRIVISLERIRIRPEHFLIKLVNEESYKLRIGDYRAIIDLDNSKSLMMVIKIGHRSNIYKD